MTIITEAAPAQEKTAVSLGIFDGIHHGHRRVLSEVLKRNAPAVFTFRTESIKAKHGRDFEYIYTNQEKLKILESMGIKYIYSPDYDDVRNMNGEEFIENIIINIFNAGFVVCGENFRFGKNASCGAGELRKFGEKYGFDVKIIPLDGFSSEKYRQLLREGRMRELCESNDIYTLSGKVMGGNKIGRTIDFPTINQLFAERQLVPKYGVYYTNTLINGMIYKSITNIGVKPTIGNNIKPVSETHILDFSGDLYDQYISVKFLEFIRGEKKFPSLDMLKVQIAEDIKIIEKKGMV